MNFKLLYSVFFLTAVFTSSCIPESNESDPSGDLATVAREIIDASGTCTLISLDSTGYPRARVMDPFPPTEDLVIWFGTNTLSRKVSEIQKDGRVTIHYYDKGSAAYVSLYGTAIIVSDSVKKEEIWKPEWVNFYPDYPIGYSLIKVVPSRLELISEKHEITGDTITWQPPTIHF